MGLCGRLFKLLFMRIFPVLVLVIAIFVGWIFAHPIPEGRMFATVIPMVGGYLPTTIFGPWKTPGTAQVPDDMKPKPRPKDELFLSLPAGGQMPAQGLGMCCRPTAYDDETVRRTVLWYFLEGGRHIDTAELYLNHRAIGQGIKEAISRGVPRSEMFIVTKIFPVHYGLDTATTLVPTYLEELGVEYLDLVLMHAPKRMFPGTGIQECTSKGLSLKLCRQETWKALSALRKKGVVREVGVSNFNVRQMEELSSLPDVAPIAANQFQFNPWAPDWQQENYAYCQKHGIAVTAWGSLSGTIMKTAEVLTVETLKSIANTHKRTPAQVLLRWALQKKTSIIPGTGNPKHMRENLEVYNFKLSSAELESIDALRSDGNAQAFYADMKDDS